MGHTQAVFLGHYIPIQIAFWLWCWYQSEKRKKSVKATKLNCEKVGLIERR